MKDQDVIKAFSKLRDKRGADLQAAEQELEKLEEHVKEERKRLRKKILGLRELCRSLDEELY